MRCETCGVFYIRAPCPSCNSEKVQIEDMENTEEVMVKPSELQGRSAVNPNFQPGEEEEAIDEAIPSFQRYEQQHDESLDLRRDRVISKPKPAEVKQEVVTIQKEVSDIAMTSETDEQYRKRVRDTLTEVMSLLEKLIE